jgi:RNA polymerase sigma factor (sigma-70 family)
MNDTEDQQRFRAILAQHSGILYKVVRTYCAEVADQEDLLQEIKIQIWRSLHRYDEKFALTTWLYRIALNVAISHYRKHTKRNAYTIPLSEQLSETRAMENNAPEKEQQLRLLEQFINELNELDKALMLLYLEDKKQAEIADILGISPSNVATKISRIKERLKIRFSKLN